MKKMYRNPFETLYDAAIFGGGLSGISAAVNLALAGKKIILVERRAQPGWEVTSAFNCAFAKSECSTAEKIRKELKSAGAWKNGIVSPPIAEIFLSELLEKHGIDVLLYSYPLKIICKKGLACAVITGSKSGVHALRAKVFIDATEEAFLWRDTGVSFEKNPGLKYNYKIFFNSAEEGMKTGMAQSSFGMPGITIEPSVWRNEYCAGFDINENDMSNARLKLPEVVGIVRENVAWLKDAFVTHTAYELLSEDTPFSLCKEMARHPYLENLFACGIWAFPDREKRHVMNSIPGRIETGQDAGAFVKKILSQYDNYFPSIPLVSEEESVNKKISADVVIAGGGTAGAIAGIVSSGKGVRTLIIEAGTMLGGMGTGGTVHNYYHGAPGGIRDEIERKVEELAPVFCGKYKVRGFHPEARKVVLEQMCRDAGVQVMYGATALGVKMSGKKLKGLFLVTSCEKLFCSGRVFLDSTGDGDIAAMAGASFTTGREVDGLTHIYTQSAGWFDRNNNFFRGVNFDTGYADSFDITDLTRARRHGLSCFRKKKYDDLNRPFYISPMIGIRQGRNIRGDYLLTFEDEIRGRRFRDAVGFINAHYDSHFYRTRDIAGLRDDVLLWSAILGNFLRKIGCEIPYRCLLPAGIGGLIVACRALSAENEAHFAFRMQRDMQKVGEAAGLAAAMAARNNVSPRRVDIMLLQDELRKTGVLDEKFRPSPAVPHHSFRELKKIFLSGDARDAVWKFSFDRRAIPFLKKVLEEGTASQKFQAAVALAMHKKEECVPELIKRVSCRDEKVPEGLFALPSWESSVILLGRAGNDMAIPVLLDILKEKDVSLDAILFTLKALERIGSGKSASGIMKFLERKDISAARILHGGSPITNPVKENVMWQVELSAAGARKKLGKPLPRLVKKYLHDPRSYVRRYAANILK